MAETPERRRLADADAGGSPWRDWGPYLSERAWGSVREDYSADGDAWSYFPFDHARSRVYRWSEDGLAGLSNLNQDWCFALAFWNGRDPILKERAFGLGNADPTGDTLRVPKTVSPCPVHASTPSSFQPAAVRASQCGKPPTTTTAYCSGTPASGIAGEISICEFAECHMQEADQLASRGPDAGVGQVPAKSMLVMEAVSRNHRPEQSRPARSAPKPSRPKMPCEGGPPRHRS